jgi:hypothetical protein
MLASDFLRWPCRVDARIDARVFWILRRATLARIIFDRAFLHGDGEG